MKTLLSLRRNHYVARANIFLIMVALIAGMTGCGGGGAVTYDLTMAADPPAGGKATDETDGSPYTAGAAVNISAEANTGYRFVGWTASAGGFADPNAEGTTFTMPAQDVTVTASFELTPPEHFKGYMVNETTAPHIGEVVSLEDEFGAFTATVEEATGFGNAAEKLHDDVMTRILNPDQHATVYTITCQEEPQVWRVIVSNQFGYDQELIVSGPVGLAVPTQTQGHEPPVGLDHYLLYEVVEGPGIYETISLTDEFGTDGSVWVNTPILFGNPVRTTHGDTVTEIVNPHVRAVMYSIDVNYFEKEVQIVNQFGPQTLDVYTPYGSGTLGVPSKFERYPERIQIQMGVKAGDWIKLEFTTTGWPAEESYPEWMKLEFLSVEGITLTVRETMRMSDGTEESSTMSGDLLEPSELGGLVIAANLTTGDSVYMAGYEYVALEGETTKTYAGANRTVVYATFLDYETLVTFYWDKLTGVIVELSIAYLDVTMVAKATETNMW